ncbi:MAG: hypothetical protein RIB46_06250 [Pseudomonadales bacterium]
MNLWQYLLLATAAGVLLNVTPCVLPVLPIKLHSIGRVVGASPGKRLLAGAALLAGTLTFFGGLALATASLNWTWGTIFQSPGFRAALALVLGGLGVWSLAGRGIQPPQWASGSGARAMPSPISPVCWPRCCRRLVPGLFSAACWPSH